VEHIVMIFGSARSKTPKDYEEALAELKEKVKTDPSVQPSLTRLERMSFLCRYHEETVKLASLITEFSEERKLQGLPTYTVGTGAGPGMMEAANHGAWLVGGKSVGFGISLPFETGLNPYVTPELGFEFHYFFTRKFWMAYECMGLVVAPGGYGTCDELFEILTLIQTRKIKRRLPVILFGEEYWTQVLHFNVMEEYGLLSSRYEDLVFACDTAEAAFEHLKKFWLKEEASGVAARPTHKQVAAHTNGHTNGKEEKRRRRDNDPIPERPMPLKAYKNMDYINSHHTRIWRIQCEFEETALRLAAEGIDNTLMFIGSGAVKSAEDHLAEFTKAMSDPEKGKDTMLRLQRQQPLLKYRQVSRDLARRITSWSMERAKAGQNSYHVATGGGPGLIEAANEGAWEAGGRSLAFSGGVNEQMHFNNYVTPELAFIFHYFFTRKFWMAYKCMGVVAMPGGFGTADELFEMLTLMQTGKIKRKIPVVLVGVDYWKRAVHWQKMADYGMISDQDVSQLLFTDSADEAFNHIVAFWERLEEEARNAPPKEKKGGKK